MRRRSHDKPVGHIPQATRLERWNAPVYVQRGRFVDDRGRDITAKVERDLGGAIARDIRRNPRKAAKAYAKVANKRGRR